MSEKELQSAPEVSDHDEHDAGSEEGSDEEDNELALLLGDDLVRALQLRTLSSSLSG